MREISPNIWKLLNCLKSSVLQVNIKNNHGVSWKQIISFGVVLVLLSLIPSQFDFFLQKVEASDELPVKGNINWDVKQSHELTLDQPYTLTSSYSGSVTLVSENENTLIFQGQVKILWEYNQPQFSQGLGVSCKPHHDSGTSEHTITIEIPKNPIHDPVQLEIGLPINPTPHYYGMRCTNNGGDYEAPAVIPFVYGEFDPFLLSELDDGYYMENRNQVGANSYSRIQQDITFDPSTKLQFKITGKVNDLVQNVPLPKSIVVLGDYENMPKGNGYYLSKLSSSTKPQFEQKVDVSNDGKYEFAEFEKKRDKDGFLPTMVVVSLLWYDSSSNSFAITNSQDSSGTKIPLYLVQCISDDANHSVGLKSCLKWLKTDNSGGFQTYEAKVNFDYGANLSPENIMERENWNPGSAVTISKLMTDGGEVYHNAYNAFTFLEHVKDSTGTQLKPVIIQIRDTTDQLCIDQPERAEYRPHDPPISFGDLGSPLGKVEATGHVIHLCDLVSGYNQIDAPINREYHELSHYLQYQMYDPDNPPPCLPDDNHGGYNNCSSHDSVIEAFAMFNALLINEYVTHTQSSLYPIRNAIRDIEIDYKVWSLGLSPIIMNTEISAVTGMLWDLHDVTPWEIHSDVSTVYPISADKISLTADEILKLIHDGQPRTIVDLYNIFKPKGDGVDMIFVNHGAFNDVVLRDYIHEAGENIGYTGSLHDPIRPTRENLGPSLNSSYIQTNTDAAFEVNVVHDRPYSYYDFSYTLNMTANEPVYFEMAPQYFPSKAFFSQISYLPDGSTKMIAANVTIIDSTDYWKYVNASEPKSDIGIFKTISTQSTSPATTQNPTSDKAIPEFPTIASLVFVMSIFTIIGFAMISRKRDLFLFGKN